MYACSLCSVFLPLIRLFKLLDLFRGLVPRIALLCTSNLFKFGLIGVLHPVRLGGDVSRGSGVPNIAFVLMTLFYLITFSFVCVGLSNVTVFGFSRVSDHARLKRGVSRL